MKRREFFGAAAAAVATATLAGSQLTGSASAASNGHAPAGLPVNGETSALLDQVQKAHGGLGLWRQAKAVTADATYGGPFWAAKGVADFVGTDHVVADVQRQHIRLVQPSGRIIEFDKHFDVVTVTEPDGTVERLEHPRASFDGYTAASQWSVAQAGYFRCYASWLYLIESYVFTYPGVKITEVEPWVENGETWRVLSVTFPTSIDVQSTTQRYYFDRDGFMVRQDYNPAINGGVPVAHYQPTRIKVHGAVVTTEHQIFSRNPDNTPDRSVELISMDVADITVR
jgi:hypothetical protein